MFINEVIYSKQLKCDGSIGIRAINLSLEDREVSCLMTVLLRNVTFKTHIDIMI